MMYKYALFFHIIGALVLFAGLGIELTGLLNIKKTNQQILIPKILKMSRVYGIAMLLIILPGIHMMAEVWGFNSWIITAFIGIIINSILFTNVTGKRIKYFLKSAAEDGNNVSSGNDEITNDPVLWLSLNLRIAVIIGIVFLMTIKPGMVFSIVTLIVSATAGLLFPSLKKKINKSNEISLVNNR